MQMQVMFFINESDVYFTISSILNSHLSTHPKGMARAEQSIGLAGDSHEEVIRGSPMGGQCWEKTGHQILHEPWCKLDNPGEQWSFWYVLRLPFLPVHLLHSLFLSTGSRNVHHSLQTLMEHIILENEKTLKSIYRCA